MNSNFPPQTPFGSELPIMNSAMAVARIETGLSECEQIAKQLVDTLHTSISDCLASCDAIAERCHDCISGRIQIILDGAQNTSDKCVAKIFSRMSDTLGEAYWYAQDYVGPPPSIDDLTIWINGGMRIAPPIGKVGPCGPPAINSNPPQCPVGTHANYNVSTECWECVPNSTGSPVVIPPTSGTGPPLGGCVTIGNSYYCDPHTTPPLIPNPPGSIGGTGSGNPPLDCGGGAICPPTDNGNQSGDGEIPVSTTCAIIPPEPICKPPQQPCPEGMQWVWVASKKAFQCQPNPKPTAPAHPPQTGGSNLGILDIIGLYEWNADKCPDFSAVVFSGNEGEEAKKNANAILERAANSLSSSIALPGENPVSGIINSVSSTVVHGFIDAIESIYDWSVEEMESYHGCNIVGATGVFAVRGILSFVEEWTNVGFDELITHMDHAFRYHCPSELPGQGDIDGAYLANVINDDTWRCWTRAANDMDKPAWQILKSKRTQPSLVDWIHASWQNILGGATLAERLRQSGVIQGDDAFVLEEMQRPMPHLQEIIRYIHTHLGDPLTLQKYDMVLDRDKGIAPIVSAYLDSTGASKDTIDYAWRNHFRVIGLPELAQMEFRFRADSLNADWQGLALDDVDKRYVLDGNAIPGYWADRLRETYRPTVSIRHLHGLVKFSGWGTVELVNALKTDGFTQRDADTISSNILSHVKDEEFKALSVLSPHAIGTAYANGWTSTAECYAMFAEIGEEKASADVTIRQATWLRLIEQRKDYVNNIHTRYMGGEFNKDTALEDMAASGMPVDQALILISGWEYKLTSKGKEFVPSELCSLFDNGLIDGNEYMKRLLRLGWNAGDATKHVVQCGIKISARAAAAAQKNRPKPGRPPRQLSVADLCTLFAQQLITMDEYTEHMTRQGFEKEDSDKLVASCQAKIASKNGKPH